MKVAIVDYGVGNLRSVVRGVLKVDAHPIVTSNVLEIRKSDGLILPGVGIFSYAMRNIRDSGLHEAILDFAKSGKPILGICLGFQLLFNTSEESESVIGLGLFSGNVKKLSKTDIGVEGDRALNIGWNKVRDDSKDDNWFRSFTDKYFYFVHSYGVTADDVDGTKLVSEFGNHRLCASLKHENIIGCQFHPEKSDVHGLSFLSKCFFDQ